MLFDWISFGVVVVLIDRMGVDNRDTSFRGNDVVVVEAPSFYFWLIGSVSVDFCLIGTAPEAFYHFW